MRHYDQVLDSLRQSCQSWLVTGVAGFIGSNLLEELLRLDQRVIGLDNYSTGHQRNLDEVRSLVDARQWANFTFIEGDICDLATCRAAVEDCDHVLHQAALGSVPRSIDDPILSNACNVDGFLNILIAARDQQVSSFTFAASSATYGDHPDLPKVEDQIGNPLSPYAVTKLVNELYAGVFALCYGFKSIGLRYFNVFGPRQDPQGAYAAVIPRWIDILSSGDTATINGDGETSRDFCYIENVVQANLLAATASDDAKDQIYNIAVGEQTSLNQLYELICAAIVDKTTGFQCAPVQYAPFRTGDVRHSLADISKAESLLGFQPSIQIAEGISMTVDACLSSSGRG